MSEESLGCRFCGSGAPLTRPIPPAGTAVSCSLPSCCSCFSSAPISSVALAAVSGSLLVVLEGTSDSEVEGDTLHKRIQDIVLGWGVRRSCVEAPPAWSNLEAGMAYRGHGPWLLMRLMDNVKHRQTACGLESCQSQASATPVPVHSLEVLGWEDPTKYLQPAAHSTVAVRTCLAAYVETPQSEQWMPP